MKLGIVGLPNVGKSTLFNAITSTKNAEAANYPFCTIEPNSGIVAVPDKRLDKLAEVLHRTSRRRGNWAAKATLPYSPVRMDGTTPSTTAIIL